MRKLFTLLTCCISVHVSAQTLLVPGKPGEQKIMQNIFEELVIRSDRFDSIEHYYGNAGDPNTEKMIQDLNNGHTSITYVAASVENEANMNAIYFPIYRGLLGMRLGIVKQEYKDNLQHIEQPHQLKQLVACQGKAWPDTTILEANGIKVAKSLKYPNLFPMLEGERCDYFPRGVFEPFSEVIHQKEYNLAVDEHMMLRYKMPFYFYTAKSDPELAQHFQEIIYDMFEDGTYEALFFEDEEISSALKLAKLEGRIIFDLTNPAITENTRNIPERFWYNPLKGTQ